MTNQKTHWQYPVTRHHRGITAVVTAVTGELLFTFFLLVGFGDTFWSLPASGVISLLMLTLGLYGVSLSRSGRGGVAVTADALIIERGRQRVVLPWSAMQPIVFGGVFQPCLKLQAGSARGVIYKALPGYPLLWGQLSTTLAQAWPSNRELRFNCHRTQHQGAIAAATLLFWTAAILLGLVIPAGQTTVLTSTVAVIFGLAGALGVGAMLRIRRSYHLDEAGITCRAWGRTTFIPAAAMQAVVLEQAMIRELAVGYRYRGEAMTTAVRYAPAALGLVVVLQLEDGNWRWDETMTGFPMERLYEELCHRYHLPGQFVIPEMAAR